MMEGNFCSTSTLQQLLHLSFLEFSKCKCPQKTFESWRSTKQFADRIESLVGLCLLGKIGQESKCNQFLATYLYFPCRLEVLNKNDREKIKVNKSAYLTLAERVRSDCKRKGFDVNPLNECSRSTVKTLLDYKFHHVQFNNLAFKAINNWSNSFGSAKVNSEIKQLGIDALRFVLTHYLVTNFEWMTSHQIASVRTQLMSTEMLNKLIIERMERIDKQTNSTQLRSVGNQLNYRQFELLAGLVCIDCSFNTKQFWHVFRLMYTRQSKKLIDILKTEKD
ncbi:uncharacterized protein LOC142345543 isoform X2 [Convolutriloba macropyga]|uniref:uncharacterized protein LOC142345543 isoform X2 n=1 Tax=Convolutriloba macropyga TaxID=536237 RepID=UPI003F528BF0